MGNQISAWSIVHANALKSMIALSLRLRLSPSGGELWAAKGIKVDAVSFVAQQRSLKRRSFSPRRSDVIRGPNGSAA